MHSDKLKMSSSLFLRNCQLVPAHGSRVDPIWQSKARIEPNVWIFRLKVFLHKQLQYKSRNFDSIERNRVYVHDPLPSAAVGVSLNNHIMHSREHAQEWIRGAPSRLELIEINPRVGCNNSRFALKFDRLHAHRKLNSSRGDVGINFFLGELSRRLIRMGRCAISLDALQLAIHARDSGGVL